MSLNLDEARRICDAATAGPWEIVHAAENAYDIVSGENETGISILADGLVLCGEDKANSEFVIFARTALPQAIAEIAELRAECDKLLEVIGKWARVGHPIMDAIEGTPLGSMGTDPEPFVRRIKELKAAELERDAARKAILSFGNNPAGFDWAVLGRIDELETENAALRAEVERLRNHIARRLPLC